MTEEPWNKHTPGDPMPCKCGDSVVEVRLREHPNDVDLAKWWDWGIIPDSPDAEITAWRFVERKGEDVIPPDPYDALEWGEDDTATVVLKEPGQPEWVRDGDRVRFWFSQPFNSGWTDANWPDFFAFQIKRRPVLTPAGSLLLAMLADADDAEAAAIRRAARRAHIEVPE